jgi:hypothetical protein
LVERPEGFHKIGIQLKHLADKALGDFSRGAASPCLAPGADYVPSKPQSDLFADVESGGGSRKGQSINGHG